jgi:DNA-binding response OmpR family regulator
MKILLAEDDFSTRTILNSILTKWGYEVIATDNGQAALEAMLEKEAPQLAVLDWMMPEMDGPEVCRRLRQEKGEDPLYLILLTARGESGDIVQGLDSGADDYIAKPYDKEELRARVNVGRRIINLQKELREKEKLQGVLEMAGAVCHELNQPLQSVIGFSELLLMDMKEDDAKYQTLIKIKSSIDRIGELTKKIMGITRYQSKSYLSKSWIIDIDGSSEDIEGGNT